MFRWFHWRCCSWKNMKCRNYKIQKLSHNVIIAVLDEPLISLAKTAHSCIFLKKSILAQTHRIPVCSSFLFSFVHASAPEAYRNTLYSLQYFSNNTRQAVHKPCTKSSPEQEREPSFMWDSPYNFCKLYTGPIQCKKINYSKKLQGTVYNFPTVRALNFPIKVHTVHLPFSPWRSSTRVIPAVLSSTIPFEKMSCIIAVCKLKEQKKPLNLPTNKNQPKTFWQRKQIPC